jgi:hypothetical protein
MLKVIVAGSRNFTDYEFLQTILKTRYTDPVEIVSGGARGADTLGEQYASEHSLPLRVFKANWAKYKKGAGYIRNEDMSDYADELVVFWDGKSGGTRHMMEVARKAGMRVGLFIY